jgi:murein L,D-transpeptidase YafK
VEQGDIEVRREEITSAVAAGMISALNTELSSRYPEEGANYFRLNHEEVAEGRGAFLVAYSRGKPVGCGAVRRLDASTAEIKRMYVENTARGKGVGRVMLAALEAEGRRLKVVICLMVVVALSMFESKADPPPSSPRSRAAIARVKPRLQQELRARGLRFGAPIFIRIFKEPKQLEVWVENGRSFELFRVYEVCTYSGRLGPKLRTGDLHSPEGFYFVNAGRMNPTSRFHLSFNVGYPNAYDRHHGRTGSALMVHGNCVSIGCYAMTNARIDEIYAMADGALRAGQPFFRVHIFPFRMTNERMQKRRKSKWRGFWNNLKEGYDWFEMTGRPPNVLIDSGRYVFGPS